MNDRILIAIFILLCLPFDHTAQVSDFKLYNISRDEGLPSENVQQIFQDSYGFLWIASFDGLFRWDGSTYKRYYCNNQDVNSISNNVVYVVFEDHKKRLWIGTLSGLDLYRRSSDDFVRCPFDISHRKIAVNAIVEDSKRNLWIGASSGLFLFHPETKSSTMFNDTQGNGMSDHVIFALDVDSKDNLWLGTFHGGVNKFSPSDKTFTVYKHKDSDPKTICSNMINELMVDEDDNVWIGSYDNGISVLDPDGKLKRHYVVNESRSIQNIISAIFQDVDKRIWFGTIKEPLCYLDPKEDRLVPFLNSAAKKHNTFCESVTSIREDSFGNLWFGTQTEGLFYTNKNKNQFEYYAFDDRRSRGLTGKIITSFVETNDGGVWIGTNNGLAYHDIKRKDFKIFTTRDGLISNDVYDVQKDSLGNLWVATWNGGISKLNLKTQRFTNYKHDSRNIFSLNYNNVKTLLPEDSIVWIGTHGEGLAVLDVRTNRITHRNNNKMFSFDMGRPAWINHIMRDAKHRIWISTFNGIFMYDRKSFFHFSHSTDGSLSSNAVNMTLEDSEGKIWALNEKGIVDRLNERNRKFERFYQSSTGAKAFTIDDHNTMWISSNEGLESVNLNSKFVKKYDEADGIVGNSFFGKSVLKSVDGKLYFGSTYGFNCFHPDSIKILNHTIRPSLVSFYLYDSLVLPNQHDGILKKVLNFTDTITLSYDQRFFAIAFTATNLVSGNRTRFSYTLKGLHDNWIDTQGERKASFTNLDPGKYVFKLRYTDALGRWMESPKQLTIFILPPWWLATWFRIIALIVLTGVVVLIFYIRLHAIKGRNRFLEVEVEKRTHDLLEANEFLVERNAEINRQSEKILLQQERIIVQNQELETSVDEARKLNQVKDRFFSILAHDLKNPIYTLTGISERFKMNLHNLDKREIEKHVDSLQRSATGVYNLLNNLLHWGATHTNSFANSPTDFSIAEVVRNNAQLLELEFQEKNITLTILVNTSHRTFADYHMVDTVIRNLLTNSVKFTYAQGEVVVESAEIEEEIIIRISDNGIGMTKDQIENVFNIEKQDLSKGTAGETGTGLGLIISREFIEANHGSITLVSNAGKGSTFSIRLPKSKRNGREDEHVTTIVSVESAHHDIDEFSVEDLMKVRGKKILIVEDNQELRTHLQIYLSTTFEIFDAPNGKAGLAKTIEVQPSVIISDLSMPVMDGVAFCQAVKSNPTLNHIPFVLLTSNSSDDSLLSGYNAGADVYLTKPVKKKLLFQVIFNLLDNQEKIRRKILDTNGFLTNDPVLNKSDLEFLDRVIDIIELNIDDPALSFKTITDGMAMSKTVVYNKLKSITGLGIQEFIKSIRLKKSLKYLSEGKLSINEIAQRVGFNSQSYFNKCFIKQFNVTPKAYMNKSRKTVVQ